jgi:hypothetical protein
MPEQNAKGGLREITIEAVVIRADGTREDLGEIAGWHKNPLVRAVKAVKRKLRR